MTLNEIINQANEKVLILPTFQRGFKWKAENIRKLLESLVLNYPIGGVLLWQTNTPIFEWRTLESVELGEQNDDDENENYNDIQLEHLGNRYKYILDGQQRLTSIYKIFPSTFNKTEYEQFHLTNQEIYRFFIDLNKLNFPILDENNFQNYDINFPTDIDIKAEACIVKNFQNIRREYRNRYNNQPDILPNNLLLDLFKEQMILPLTTSFLNGDQTILNNWISEKVFNLTNRIGGGFQTNNALNLIYQNWLSRFNEAIQTVLIQKTIPVISVPENTSWEGLSRIFETINSTGLSLTTFDLLVAKLSFWNNQQTNLRSLVKEKISPKNLTLFDDKRNLGGVGCQQLPRIFALSAAIHSNQNSSLKKSEILGLNRDLLIEVSEISCNRLEFALNLLQNELGVRNKNFLPFKDAITLSAFVKDSEINKFQAYYWYVLFTEKDLDKDTNSTTKRLYENWNDFKTKNKENLINEINNILETNFPTFEEVLNISNSTSLLYRAFITFIYSKSNTDWSNTDIHLNDTLIEDHHIFPSRWLTTNINNISTSLKNNILNRVLVSKTANSMQYAGNNAPYIYLNNSQHLLNSFAIPQSFLEENAYNEESLIEKYRERYDLIKHLIFSSINNYINEQ